MTKHTCEHSGITFDSKDESEEGYKKGYVKGYKDGYIEALEFAYNNVYHTLSHIGTMLEEYRHKVKSDSETH